jgi:hypothetical protein
MIGLLVPGLLMGAGTAEVLFVAGDWPTWRGQDPGVEWQGEDGGGVSWRGQDPGLVWRAASDE